MKKEKVGIIALVAILIIAVVGGIILIASGSKSTVELNTVEDMSRLIDQIYETTKLELMGLETHEVDLEDEYALSAATGLTDSKKITTAIVSEPMIGSIPYSLVMVKVKNKADVEKVKKDMVDNIDMRKWLCVNADILYATSYDDVIFVVYSTEDDAKPQYEEFKNIVGKNIGKELTKKFEE